jgi:hypothetical protein
MDQSLCVAELQCSGSRSTNPNLSYGEEPWNVSYLSPSPCPFVTRETGV